MDHATSLSIHSHAPHHDHGHTHEHLDHPGHFHERDLPFDHDFCKRAVTVGVGGPVGSGKTALMLQLCLRLRGRLSLAAVSLTYFEGDGLRSTSDGGSGSPRERRQSRSSFNARRVS